MCDLPGSGIELGSAALGGGFFTAETLGKPWIFFWWSPTFWEMLVTFLFGLKLKHSQKLSYWSQGELKFTPDLRIILSDHPKNLEAPENTTKTGPDILGPSCLVYAHVSPADPHAATTLRTEAAYLLPLREEMEKRYVLTSYRSVSLRQQAVSACPTPAGRATLPLRVQPTSKEGRMFKCFCEAEDPGFYWILLLISCAIQGTSLSYCEPQFPSVSEEIWTKLSLSVILTLPFCSNFLGCHS